MTKEGRTSCVKLGQTNGGVGVLISILYLNQSQVNGQCMCALPRFLRVHKMFGKFANNLTFIWCDCGFYDRCGVPCPHVFRLVDEMSINMVHICHWKVYDAHYGDNTKLGKLMIQAQVT